MQPPSEPPFVLRCNRCGAEHRATLDEHIARRWLHCGPFSRDKCAGGCGEIAEGWDWRKDDGTLVHMGQPGVAVCLECVLSHVFPMVPRDELTTCGTCGCARPRAGLCPNQRCGESCP